MTKEHKTTIHPGISLNDFKNRLLQDQEVNKEYEKLSTRYQVISQIIECRRQLKLTQSELAKRVGTTKSNISRLESGTYNPSLEFLDKIAKGLGKEIHIDLK
jgi:DNA-binding XRE family transcriptional regulator